MADADGMDRETRDEELNRQLGELLQELRIAMPGVQLLFGFLLAVPFNQRFSQVTDTQTAIYVATLLCSAMASACFIAPTAFHRIQFQRRDKPYLIRWGTRAAIAGLAFLALAMTGAVLLVIDFLFNWFTAAICTAVVAAAFGWLWFGLALSRRVQGKRTH